MATLRASRVLLLGLVAALAGLVTTPLRAEVAAWSGEPYGVAVVRVAAPSGDLTWYPDRSSVRISSAPRRALYPVVTARTEPRTGTAPAQMTAVEVRILFPGSEPFELELTFRDGSVVRETVRPAADAAVHQRELRTWWKWYIDASRDARFAGAVLATENYLLSMLARRLGFPDPGPMPAWTANQDFDQILGLLSGAESVRLAMQRDTFLNATQRREQPTESLPAAVIPPSVPIPDVPEDVAVEPIARRVPAECFYVRTGSYANFVWLRDRLDEWGGQVRSLASLRGFDYGIRGRLERQLALHETILARALGGTVISDVAVIGTDTFVREGPSIGVLFEARNGDLLSEQLELLREEAAEDEPAARFTTEEVAGREVSLLSTPDNRIRSFYAVDGRYHLVTTSRTIVRRFFEAGAGRDSLAELKEFRHARNLMPLSRGDAVFVYVSDPFFRQLISPAARVEMTRRAQAASELELVELARLAARAEGQPADSIAQLVAAGFLPPDFETRPDGSRAVLAEGRLQDSARGARGCFLPVADVEVAAVTPSEVKAYGEFARAYRALWERVDPVVVGIQRRPAAKPGRERVVLDVHITPYARQPLGFLAAFLPPPSNERVADVPDDIASLQVRLPGYLFGNTRQSGLAFAGFRDFSPAFELRNGAVDPPRPADRDTHAYLGSQREDFLAWLDARRDWNTADEEGYIRHPDGRGVLSGWARRHNDFATVSPRKEVLEQVTPHLRIEQADRPAQIRLRIADLQRRLIAPFLTAHGYVQARKASGTNARFLDTLIDQLQVPAADARRQAETILDARLVCPLGGEYELTRPAKGFAEWSSTVWAEPSLSAVNAVPADYRFDVLDWFHGLDLEFSIDRTTLETRIELELGRDGQ
ncbi:MAG TPA: hypothetical protein VML55_22435 [Planctomycetaceae bacterium]|nr:hypothetical protein [Planctomycetaceae bacterium]